MDSRKQAELLAEERDDDARYEAAYKRKLEDDDGRKSKLVVSPFKDMTSFSSLATTLFKMGFKEIFSYKDFFNTGLNNEIVEYWDGEHWRQFVRVKNDK